MQFNGKCEYITSCSIPRATLFWNCIKYMYQLQTGCNFKEIGVNQQTFTLYDFTHRFVYIYLDPISINLHFLINFSSSLFFTIWKGSRKSPVWMHIWDRHTFWLHLLFEYMHCVSYYLADRLWPSFESYFYVQVILHFYFWDLPWVREVTGMIYQT